MIYFLTNGGGALSQADGNVVDMVAGGTTYIIANILNVIRIFGTGLALIMLTWMAISYFTADGRGAFFMAEKKAQIKGEQLKNFAIGVIVFIGASNILYFIVNFVIQIAGEV